MKALCGVRGNLRLRSGFIAALVLGASAAARIAMAQAPVADIKANELRPINEEYRTFYLTSLTDPREAEDVIKDLRNMLPQAHAYYLASEGVISMRATHEDLALAEKIISDVDHKRKAYKITYTLTQKDGAPQRVELIVTTGGKTVVKQGTRVPIVTGMTDQDSNKANSQVQYLDIGMNLEASLEGDGDNLRLRTLVEQSSVSDEHSGIGAQDPVIRQTRLDDVSMLTQGKPVVLGSLDIPGGSRREEISVVSEPVK